MYNNKTAKHYIGSDKHIKRKIKELITAIKIEQTYTKSEILELYFNSVYFGHGNYGVQSAATYYFGKDVSEITVDESALYYLRSRGINKNEAMKMIISSFIEEDLSCLLYTSDAADE